MYIAALNYEFNVFSMFRRKLRTIADLYRETWAASGTCEVRQGSATDLSWLPDESIDYVFTDPPFGSNIFYADSSFLWEAWLGQQTDLAQEAVVNKRVKGDRGGKKLDGYETLMAASMTEVGRVVRPGAWASLQFHNSDDAVWSSLQRAVEQAGLAVEAAVVMDKGQASFKGLRHAAKGEKVANFDLVMHLRSAGTEKPPRGLVTDDDMAAELARYLADAPASRRTTPSLHSIAMRYLLAESADLAGWSYSAVETLASKTFEREGTAWAPRP
jgi:adenine-specific DNA methylase